MGLNPNLVRVDYLAGAGYSPSAPRGLKGWKGENREVQYHDFLPKIEEINENWQYLNHPSTGRRFRMTIANEGGQFTGLTLTKHFRPADAIDMATHAASNPGSMRVNVAFFEEGCRTFHDKQDRQYIARTNRFTKGKLEKGYGFESIEVLNSLADALEKSNIYPDFVRTGLDRWRANVGMMTALNIPGLKGLFIGVPGVSDRSGWKNRKKVDEEESRKPPIRMNSQSTGPKDMNDQDGWGIKDDFDRQIKQYMPRIYGGAVNSILRPVSRVISTPSYLAMYRGSSRHIDLADTKNHALLQDTLAALSIDLSELTFQFNRNSREHSTFDGIELGRLAMTQLHDEVPDATGVLRVLIGDGTLNRQKYVPNESWATESYALNLK